MAGIFVALGVIAASAGSPTVGLPVCLVFAFVPWLITFNATRSVMRASERGLAIGDFADQRMIPWDQVDRVALKKNEHFRVVVHAYAGSVIIDQGIESKSAEKRFTDFTRSIDQLQQMAGPSAAEASVNRRTMRAELHRGTGVQLDGAGTSATSYWAPDPTGAHDLRLISMGQWTNGGHRRRARL